MTKNYFEKDENVYIPFLRSYGNIVSVKKKYYFISCWIYKIYIYTIETNNSLEIIEDVLEDDIVKINRFIF